MVKTSMIWQFVGITFIVTVILAVGKLYSIQGAAKATTTDVLTVVPSIYGITNTTNEIIVIVSSGHANLIRVVNTSSVGSGFITNGILEMGFRFANQTIPIGQEFRACVLVASSLELVCKTGHNSPNSRPETIDLVLAGYGTSYK
jgi:hypothetical protein